MTHQLTATKEELSLKQTWLQAILDSAAELSLLARAIGTGANTSRDITELLWNSPLEDHERPQAEACRRAVAHLLTQVNDILDLSNIECGQFELAKIDFELKSLLDRTLAGVDPAAQSKRLTLKTTLAGRVPDTLNGDPIRLQQVLTKLLESAVSSAETGEITLSAVASSSDACHLYFAVTGSGMGKPRENFELGFCRTLARQMGGELNVSSEPGQASSFAFDVLFAPIVQPQNRSSDPTSFSSGYEFERPIAAKTALEAPPPTRIIKVLIAEDSEDSRFLLQEFLKKGPYEITFAENGREALEAARSRSFDLILMDIQMPVMDGLTATRLIREAEHQAGRAPTPLLALTGNARKADIELSLAAGCNAHVLKPVSKLGLLSAMEKYSMPQAQEKPPSVEANIPRGLEDAAQRYILSKKNDVPHMLHLLEMKEFEQLRILGHDIKGTGASYGFPDLTTLGGLMEHSATERNAADLSSQLVELSRYVQAATEATEASPPAILV